MNQVQLRAATPEDASAIAGICLLAGGGVFEYLYGCAQSDTNAESILTKLSALASTPYAYRRFTMAEMDGAVVGGVNVISVPDLINAEEAILPAMFQTLGLSRMTVFRTAFRRIRIGLRMRGQRPDAATLVLANVAVFGEYAGKGIGEQLVQHVLDRAAKENYPSVSLVVWDSNSRARTLYQRMGFELVDTAPFKPLRNLRYRARCLMVHQFS